MIKKYYFFIPVVIALIGTLVFVLWPALTASKPSGHMNAFAACLSHKGIKMYGSDTCEQCLVQKKMFGDAFRNINYINCDFNKSCDELGAQRLYPTWVLGDQKLFGVQSLNQLSQLSACRL